MPDAKIEFKCHADECGHLNSFEIEVGSPNLMAERMSDGDCIEEHDVFCDECNAHYKVETCNGMGGITASIHGENIEIEVELDDEPDLHDFSDYEDYLFQYEPEKLPYNRFKEANSELLGLLNAKEDSPTGILRRMIHSQLISILEAYLSDCLLQLIQTNLDAKVRLIQKADFVGQIAITSKDLLLDPTAAEKSFRVSIQSITYHDLGKVEKVFNIALAGSFYPTNCNFQSALIDAVKVRHDCVHRNGRSKDGMPISFEILEIETLQSNIAALVDHIENQVRQMS